MSCRSDRAALRPPRRPADDPAFLREERQFLERQCEALHLMERNREQLERDIEAARDAGARARDLARPSVDAAESGIRAWLALIGVGNRFRRDDAAGLEVAARLRAPRPPG